MFETTFKWPLSGQILSSHHRLKPSTSCMHICVAAGQCNRRKTELRINKILPSVARDSRAFQGLVILCTPFVFASVSSGIYKSSRQHNHKPFGYFACGRLLFPRLNHYGWFLPSRCRNIAIRTPRVFPGFLLPLFLLLSKGSHVEPLTISQHGSSSDFMALVPPKWGFPLCD